MRWKINSIKKRWLCQWFAYQIVVEMLISISILFYFYFIIYMQNLT